MSITTIDSNTTAPTHPPGERTERTHIAVSAAESGAL